MRYLKKVVVVLLSFILFIDLLSIVFSFFVRNRLLNEKVYFDVLKKNGVYKLVGEEASKELKNFIEEKKIRGFKAEEYVDEAFVEANVNRLIYGFIDYLTKTEGEIPRISLSLDKELINKTDDYYKKEGKTLSDKEIKVLEKLGSELNSVVEEKINLDVFSKLEKNGVFLWARDIISNLYRNLNFYIFILLAGLSILFFMTNYNGFKILSLELFITGMLLAVPFYTLYYTRYFSLINIDEVLIKNALYELLNSFSLYIANIGLVFLIISIPIYYVYRIYKTR
ncbi:hypothetical protein [Caloramator proteoclasticus]|uniref:Uncharacterized protein n=1 Tax=Caloramator proteoclasticus DSM 10124 TaxID=1121262 RepID=A0A1M4WK15_9CLOT|nr:hypothetical protein [Caloramator proteoclasticus]SHE81500.1 hypothetical protein SAMN02746091_01170 [Caloramator proteoclasticus DSM 10124]